MSGELDERGGSLASMMLSIKNKVIRLAMALSGTGQSSWSQLVEL